jgi:hypothetical protein
MMATSDKPSETVVPPEDGHKHGYIGRVTDDTPNQQYTVEGQAGGTASVDDKPKSTQRSSTSKS